MAGLPALEILGLRGREAWIALAAGSIAGLFIANKALPALAGGDGARSSSQSSGGATADMLAAFAKAIAQTSAGVATAALGPGAQLGAAGVRLAGDVTQTLGDVAASATSALGGVAASATTALASTNRTLASVVENIAPAPAADSITVPVSQPVTSSTPRVSLASAPPTVKPIVVTPSPIATSQVGTTITPPQKLAAPLVSDATGGTGVIPKGAVIQYIDGVPVSLSAAAVAAGGIK